VDARGRGAWNYPLGELTAGELEALTYLLARAEDEAVVPVRNQDRGLDVRLPDERQLTRRGWQAKHFEKGKIHWGQCRDSVETAVAFWRPPRITFVFAHELSADEQTKFRTELVERVDLPVVLDYMPQAEIQRRLRDTPEGRQAAAWLFEGSESEAEAMRRAYAMAGELRDAAHAAERLAEIQRHLGRDPHLDYTTITGDVGAPPTPPAQGTALSVITQDGNQEVRFDAREKFPGALTQLGLERAVVFTEDEDGAKAREALLEAQRTGGTVSIQSGIGIKMTKVPVGMRGVMTDEPVFGQVTLTPLPSASESAPEPPSLVGIIAAGKQELGIAFAPAEEPVPGWDMTLGGAAGGLEIFHSVRGEPQALEHTLDWRHTFGEGSALEQLLACRVLIAALEGEPVRLLEPGTRKQIWLLAPVEDDHAEDIRDLKARERLLELVAELEAWTGKPLVVPARPTDEDLRALSRALGRIRSPEVAGSWDRVQVVFEGDLPADVVEVIAFEARHATLFGYEVFLGVEAHRLPRAIVTPTEDGAELTPVEGREQMVALLHRPSDYPAEAARPPGQTTGGRVMYRKPWKNAGNSSNR
jgi:hypothetical protein